ncbi:MAG TPA: histidine phosphatase family protein [Thermodesulfobacteriaceae bacterium]|nr:histidine phosphatase family protein [Thermodesulfobacteriaceae bacterium]
MENLLLARHASIEPRFRGTYVGSSDVGLGSGWTEEIPLLARAVLPYRPGVLICSPMKRAVQTAESLAPVVGLQDSDIRIVHDLREIDFGRWERMTFSEIAASEPEMVELWADWSEDFCFPEGERIGDFLARVRRAAGRLVRMEYETVLVITHGGVIRMMICHMLGLAPEHYVLFDIKPAGICALRCHEEKGVLTGLNMCVTR